MGKVKYSEEMKLQTVKYVLDGGKSATKVAKELEMESFFATLKKELTFRKTYATIEEVRTDLFRYIEILYNRKPSAELPGQSWHPRLYESGGFSACQFVKKQSRPAARLYAFHAALFSVPLRSTSNRKIAIEDDA